MISFFACVFFPTQLNSVSNSKLIKQAHILSFSGFKTFKLAKSYHQPHVALQAYAEECSPIYLRDIYS